MVYGVQLDVTMLTKCHKSVINFGDFRCESNPRIFFSPGLGLGNLLTPSTTKVNKLFQKLFFKEFTIIKNFLTTIKVLRSFDILPNKKSIFSPSFPKKWICMKLLQCTVKNQVYTVQMYIKSNWNMNVHLSPLTLSLWSVTISPVTCLM